MSVATATETIQIRGARTHNLQNIDVDLPVGRLIVITGVSGSGKSSLAFDTLFAEGQRRYLESVSVHTRSLLKQLPRPEVSEISGLPPTVSVDQRVTTAPGRSTLAVTTEIYDYLRLLYARAGTAHCTGCGQPVESQSTEQIVDRVLQRPERTKLMVLSPLIRSRRGGHKEVLERIARSGFVRARVDGTLYDITDIPELAVRREHSIDAVIDRIILKDGIQQRLRESVELAVRESDGSCIICEQRDGEWVDSLFSTRFSCAACDLNFPAPEPRTFSFNSAWGACPDCEGFGIQGVVDNSDDITVFRKTSCSTCHGSRLQPFASQITFLSHSIAAFTALSVDDALTLVDSWIERVAPDRTHGETGASPRPLTQEAALVALRTLPDIARRLRCLQQVGVGYLNLNRTTRTLSGGEFQRARLAACLGTGLHGACFVLDEPTSGLHPRDTQQLLTTLRAIRDSGATVVVVEHDSEVMRAADHILDLGPGAGIEGGRLLYSGPCSAADQTDSPTGRCLRGELILPSPEADHTIRKNESGSTGTLFPDDDSTPTAQLTIRRARRNNLQNLTVTIPLNRLVCVTGVSGSGKSSLVMDTLLPVVKAHCRGDDSLQTAIADAECDGIDGLDQVRRVVAVDNTPLGRNRRSCIATYSGMWNEVRKVFAKTRAARARGFTTRRFSFNSGDGRCDSCRGTGVTDVRMKFLPDAVVPCPACDGRRFNRATLSVRFAGHSVADILALRVDEAANVFGELQSMRRILETFRSVGLGYLTLGQPASTFSGGEAQRVKLATELATPQSESTLFILDEPTSGLHPADVVHLNRLLRALVESDHSVVVVEHNTDVMLTSDWLIDIGPESAASGGRLVIQGPPLQVAQNGRGATAECLQTGISRRLA